MDKTERQLMYNLTYVNKVNQEKEKDFLRFTIVVNL